MKFIKKNKNKIIISVIILLLIFILIYLILNLHTSKTSKGTNNYRFKSGTIELPGTNTITNDTLQTGHCLNNEICIENVKIYYINNEGRVDYTIHNIKNITKSGYLKLIFGNEYLIVAYRNLGGNKSIKTSSYYENIDLSNIKNYTVAELTTDEISQIIDNTKSSTDQTTEES